MEHSALQIMFKTQKEENARISDNLKNTSSTLKLSDQMCKKLEYNLSVLDEKYKALLEAYAERDELYKSFKIQFEHSQSKIIEIERTAETLEIEKNSAI